MKKITDQDIKYIIDCLKNGETVPAKYKEAIFGKEIEKKEYELKYAGKEREEDIIANTYSAPLQKIRTFHPDEIIEHKDFIREPETKKDFSGWYNKLIFGDNLQVLKTLLTDKVLQRQIQENGGIKLIYIDPPFATKSDFTAGQGEKAYSDKIAGAEFIEFIRKRLVLMRELLADDGFLIIHLDQKKAQYIKILMDELFGEHNFVNELIWSYRSGGASKTESLPKKHDNLFVFRKTKIAKVNPQKERQYLEKKFIGTLTDEKGRFYVDTLLRDVFEGVINIFDGKKVIEYSTRPVLNVSKERIGYPTQKPEGLLGLIIQIFSKKGDIVLDAFAGSGTTLAVAEKLGRKWIGIDGGKLSIYTIQNRLMNLKEEIGNKGKDLKPKQFAVYNAGLYDFKILKNLDWDSFVWFTLSLFGAKPEKHKIDGIPFDGKLNMHSVQVFDYNHGRKGIVLDRSYLENLDEKIGNKIGKRIYIIAPATKIDGIMEDVVNINGREYFLLRVPYSIIKELYTKEFEKIKQPTSEDDVNNTVEAVGFDFIRIPKVKVDYRLDGEKAEIKINTFESKVISKKKLDYKNLETLSTVIIDYEYNGKWLNFEKVLFADTIKKNDYVIELDKDRLNKDCMIVYIDIFGNEKKEIITLENFTK